MRIKSNGKSNGKCIMVSYARQEAAQHALNLKQELVERGFSVYLVSEPHLNVTEVSD